MQFDLKSLIRNAIDEAKKEIKEEFEAQLKEEIKFLIKGSNENNFTESKTDRILNMEFKTVDYKEKIVFPPSYPAHKWKEILNGFKNGLSIKEMADQHNIPSHSIENFLINHIRVTNKSRKLWTSLEVEKLIQMRKSGSTLDELAIYFNRTLKSIEMKLHSIGIRKNDFIKPTKCDKETTSSQHLKYYPNYLSEEKAIEVYKALNEKVSFKEVALLYGLPVKKIELFALHNLERRQYPRSPKWSLSDINLAKQMRKSGSALDEISQKLGRPLWGVYKILNKWRAN